MTYLRRKRIFQAYFVELIAGVLTLFTDCQNSTWFQKYDQFNFQGPDIYIGNRGVIFGTFFTIFAYKIVNIDVESTKIVTKMQIMNRITLKILKMKNFQNFDLQDLFCDYIHGLHLCDNFGAFNINIDNFMGKYSEKITKNYPSISYIKVKTLKIELVIASEACRILTF